jgi:membrane protease subunit HflK
MGSEKKSGSESFSKKGQNFFDKFSSKGSGSKDPNDIYNKKQNTPKSFVGIVVLVVLTIWLASGLYKVNPDENAIVLYFGKIHSITTPGLNYHIPFPVGKIIKKSVTTVNAEEFGSGGFVNSKNSARSSDGLMLTGDENIVDIDFQVQWQISDIKKFVFNMANPNVAVRKAAESTMREVIARKPIADALSDGKKAIEQEAKAQLQEILDYYGAGVRVILVQMRRVDPPSQVIDAFRDVQTARADREKEINQSQAYSNDIIPRARGEAANLTEQAQAYKSEVVANAEGQADRFLSVYNQYVKAKDVTKKRIYLETMEKIYRDTDKVIIDQNAAKSGVVPYLPLNNLTKKTEVVVLPTVKDKE